MKRLTISLNLDTADGGLWWATLDDHINIQESPIGCGVTPAEAIENLMVECTNEDVERNLQDPDLVPSYTLEDGRTKFLDEHRAQGGKL